MAMIKIEERAWINPLQVTQMHWTSDGLELIIHLSEGETVRLKGGEQPQVIEQQILKALGDK